MYSQYVEILKQAPKHQFNFREWLNAMDSSFILKTSLAVICIMMLSSCILVFIAYNCEKDVKEVIGDVFILLALILVSIIFVIRQCNVVYKSIQYKNVESYISKNIDIKGEHLYVLEDDKKTMEALENKRDVLLYDQNNRVINANAFPNKVSDKDYNHAIANGKDIDKMTLIGNKEKTLSSLINSKKLKEMSEISSVEEKGNKTIIYYVDKK